MKNNKSISGGKIARAKEMGETIGLLKVFIEAETDKILGATFVGVGADEYIHTIMDPMYDGSSYEVIGEMRFIFAPP